MLHGSSHGLLTRHNLLLVFSLALFLKLPAGSATLLGGLWRSSLLFEFRCPGFRRHVM